MDALQTVVLAHKLAFRLDPFSTKTSEVRVTNVSFKRFNGSMVIDIDNDGIGADDDPDNDGDGVEDGLDLIPDDPNEWSDNDGDGIGDFIDHKVDRHPLAMYR